MEEKDLEGFQGVGGKAELRGGSEESIVYYFFFPFFWWGVWIGFKTLDFGPQLFFWFFCFPVSSFLAGMFR